MAIDTSIDTWSFMAPIPGLKKRIKELEAENVRLRQQRDAANAQLDFIRENLKCDTPSEQNVSSQD